MFSRENERIEEAYRTMLYEGWWSDFWNSKPAWTEEPTGFNYSDGTYGHGKEISDAEAAGYNTGAKNAISTAADVGLTVIPYTGALKLLSAGRYLPALTTAGKSYLIWDVAVQNASEAGAEKLAEYLKQKNSEQSAEEQKRLDAEAAVKAEEIAKKTHSLEEITAEVEKNKNLVSSIEQSDNANPKLFEAAMAGLLGSVIVLGLYQIGRKIFGNKTVKKPLYNTVSK